MIEIEVDGDGLALWGSDVDGGGAGGKGFDGEIKLQRGTCERAAAVLGADEIRLAHRGEGPQLLVFAGDLNVEICPEIIGTGDEAGGRTGAGTGGTNDKRSIRIGKLDLNYDPYEFALVAMVERRLLSTVTGSVLAGLLDEKGEGSEESDRGDVGTRFRWQKEFRVFVEERGHRLVMALAEEIGFADGLVGQGCVEGEGRLAD